MPKKKIPHETTYLWKTTLRTIRFIKAYTGESMVQIMDRLATQELERLEGESEQRRNQSG